MGDGREGGREREERVRTVFYIYIYLPTTASTDGRFQVIKGVAEMNQKWYARG